VEQIHHHQYRLILTSDQHILSSTHHPNFKMKYSFAFVLCLGALVLQSSARPQSPVDAPPSTPAPPQTSSPSAESVGADTEAVTEVTNAGEQVVFDEGEPVVGATNDADADADTPTTSMPEEETKQDEVTTTPPCTGDDCSSAVVLEDAPSSTDDAPAAPSEDDAIEVVTTTTQAPTDSS